MKSLVVLFACILLFVHSVEASLPGVNDTDRFKFQKDDPILSQMDSLDVVNFFKRHTFTADVNKLNIYNYAKDSVPMFSDDVYRQRLQKLDKQSPFALDYNNDVRKYIELYAVKRRGTAQRMLGLAELYFPLFEEVLSKYNMPLELKYLAIVESALNPTIKSKAGAMGLWQFMYGTGKLYGLQINSYIDERCDPIKSTEAAARYLKYLYKYYNNDWQLALAAYNAGPGNVNKAIRRAGGQKSYWELRPYLPKETGGYVPAFIAVNYVMAHHKEHNIYPQKPKYFYYELDSIYIKQHLSFKQVSDYLKIPIEELRILNPAFIKDEIPETENGYPLFLPKNLIGDFIANQDLIMKKSEPVVSIETPVKKDTVTTTTTPSNNTGAANEVVYKVQKGDWLSNIAKKFNVSVQQIKDWNKLSSETLYVGQILKIQSSNETNTTVNSTNTTSPPKQSGSTKYHTIRSGDTLWGLAQKYNTSIDNLRKWNNLYSGKSIHIGMKIIVSKG
jgi:membrane-bound lytic murein transglycosylase D